MEGIQFDTNPVSGFQILKSGYIDIITPISVGLTPFCRSRIVICINFSRFHNHIKTPHKILGKVFCD